METLRQLLDRKGTEVVTTDPQATVLAAITTMAERNIGSLVVVEEDKPVGIFTERHYAREVFLKGKRSPKTPIRDVMSRRVVCVSPRASVDECMAVMTEKRIRHLPVVEDGTLVGIVSIGDLVKSRIAGQEFIIEQLTQYIHG